MKMAYRCINVFKVSIEAQTKDGSSLAIVDIAVAADDAGLAKYLAERAVRALGYDEVRTVTVELVNIPAVIGLIRPVEDIAPTEAYLVDEYGRLYPE